MIADGTRYGYRQTAHDKKGVPIGPLAQSDWLRVVPWGLYKTLKYAAGRYPGTQLFVTENGVSAPGEANMKTEERVLDGFRVGYFAAYLDELCRAVDEGEFGCGGRMLSLAAAAGDWLLSDAAVDRTPPTQPTHPSQPHPTTTETRQASPSPPTLPGA